MFLSRGNTHMTGLSACNDIAVREMSPLRSEAGVEALHLGGAGLLQERHCPLCFELAANRKVPSKFFWILVVSTPYANVFHVNLVFGQHALRVLSVVEGNCAYERFNCSDHFLGPYSRGILNL